MATGMERLKRAMGQTNAAVAEAEGQEHSGLNRLKAAMAASGTAAPLQSTQGKQTTPTWNVTEDDVRSASEAYDRARAESYSASMALGAALTARGQNPFSDSIPELQTAANDAIARSQAAQAAEREALERFNTLAAQFQKAEEERKYNSLRSNSDYATLSRGDAETARKNPTSAYYQIFHRNDPEKAPEDIYTGLGSALLARDIVNYQKPSYTAGNDLSFISDDEAGNFFYLWNTQGEKAANEYLDTIRSRLNERRDAEQQRLTEVYTAMEPGKASLESVLQNQLSIAGVVDLTVQNLRRRFGDKLTPIDYNTPAQDFGKTTQRIREAVAEDLEEKYPDATLFGITNLAAFAYQTGMSMADSATQLLLNQLGVPQAVTLSLMAGGAAQQAVYDAKKRGASDGQALAYGYAAGLAEAAFEKISLDNLVDSFVKKSGATIGEKLTKNWLDGFAKRFAAGLIDVSAQGGVEASEEAFTSIANTITDIMINQDNSELLGNIRELAESGDEQAVKTALSDWAKGILLDAIGGLVSGIGMGSAGAGVNWGLNTAARIGENREYGNIGKLYRQADKDLIREGLQLPEGTAGRNVAEEILEKLAQGQKVTNADLGRLVLANETTIREMEGGRGDATQSGAAGAGTQTEGQISLPTYEEDAENIPTSQDKTRYSFSEVPAPTYEQLIQKPNIPVTDIRRARSGSFARERADFLNSDRAKELYSAPVENRDTGESIFITPATITHTFSNLGWEQIELAYHLPEIIENAVLTHAEPSRNAPGDHTTGVYTLFGAARTETGIQPVKLTVKEYNIEGQDIPQTIADYLGNGLQPETFASTYDGKVLVLEGIEKEGPSSSAATDAATGAAVSYPSGPSEISIKDLLALVKGDAARYVPQQAGETGGTETGGTVTPGTEATPEEVRETFGDVFRKQLTGETGVQNENGGITNAEGERIAGSEPAQPGAGNGAGEQNAVAAQGNVYRGNPGGGYDDTGAEGAGTVRGGSKENRNLTEQRHRAAEDQPLQSPADFGIENGSTDQTLRVLPESEYDQEASEFTEWAYSMGMKDVKIVLGLIQIDTEAGPVSVLDVIDKDAGTLIIRGDSLKRSLTETGRHSVGHYITEQAQVEAFEQAIKASYRESAWGHLYEVYRARWAALTDNYADMTEREAELYVWEEILEDAYARVDNYGTRASVYSRDAARVLDGEQGDTAQGAGDTTLTGGVQRGTGSIRGPPERYSYGGRNANRADSETLAEAERLEMQGVDPEDIRQTTGWFRGADGLWRFEIDDSGMEYRRQGDMQYMDDPEYQEYLELWDKVVAGPGGTSEEQDRLRELDKRFGGVGRLSAIKLNNGTATLKDIIRHEELFRNYPQLRNIGIRFAELPSGTRGEYNPEQNTITLDNSLRNAPEDTLIHEIQHAIQSAEGFASGASPEYWRQHPVLKPEAKGIIQEARRRLDLVEQKFRDEWPNDTINLDLVKRYEALEDQYFNSDTADLANVEREMQEIEEAIKEAGFDDLFSEHLEASARLSMTEDEAKHHIVHPNTLYFNTAGEIEARDAAQRRNYTPRQRREIKPNTGNEDTVFAYEAEDDYSQERDVDTEGRELTQEQQDYFRDSVVRDEDGHLKVMYHGTSSAGFTVFDRYYQRYGLFGVGNYFTDDRSVAEGYTKKGKGTTPGVYEVYLNITNPMDMDAEADAQAWAQAFRDMDLDESYLDGITTNESAFRALTEALTDMEIPRWEAHETEEDLIRGMGYDGITHIGGGRYGSKDGPQHRVYITFESEQAKNIDNTAPTEHPDIRYSVEDDPETLEMLNSQPTVTVYRAMQVIDGKLYPPMAAKVSENGGKRQLVQPTELGVWYRADEHPELIDASGKFVLDKGNGSSLKAAYNPYFHTSNMMLNDQFSSAWNRDNLVVVEASIPSSELTSGYRAEGAKDPVGEMSWHSGPVASKLKGDKARRVTLSRWIKVERVVPNAEVADSIAELLEGENITIPENTVTPSLRAELEKRGVTISGKKGIPDAKTRYSVEEDNTGKKLTPAQQDYFKDSQIRDEQGRLREVYHGTGSDDFTIFDWNKTQGRDGGWFGRGFYFTFWKGEARTYGPRVLPAYLNITNPFVFKDELLELEDYRPEDTDAESLAFMINFAEKLPELAEGKTLEVVTGWDEDGYGITKEIPWSELRGEIERFMQRPDFRIMEINDAYGGNADGLKYEYVIKNGPREWDYVYSYPYMSREEAERYRFDAAVQMLFRRGGIYHSADFHMPHTYIEDIGGEFSEALKRRGYDGVLQTGEGDEIVAFYPEQIKRPDNENPTRNPDIRYSVDGGEPYTSLMERDDVALGDEDETYTENDKTVDFTWAVVPAESLIVSHDKYGDANPQYPAELQPRDRSRAASQEQVQGMYKKLNPRKLADSPTAQNGAPIIRGDGVVIGGNARSASILAAYESGYADEYENFIRERAGRYGIDTEHLPEKPVLVRIAKDADDWAALAQDLNVSSVAAYSPTETAMTDAKKMDGILELLVPNDDGDINTQDNTDFIQAFMSGVVPANERGGLMTDDGLLSQPGLERAENAIFAYAYGDPGLLAKYSESLDNDMKNITNALAQSAPAAVALRTAVENGTAYDVKAVETVLKGLEIYREAKRLKRTVNSYIAQADMMEGDNRPAAIVAGFIERNKRSAKQLRTFFNALYNEVAEYGDPDQESFFGGEDHDIREALTGAIRRYEQETGREIGDPDTWGIDGYEEVAGGYGEDNAGEADTSGGVPAESGPENAGTDGGGLPESESEALSLPTPEPEPEAPEAPTETREPEQETPAQKKERKPPRRKPPKPLPRTAKPSAIPEGYNSMEEFMASREARAAAARAERMRNISKEEFTGTPALKKLGVQIENSVGIYNHVDQLIQADRAAKQIQREAHKAERRLAATEKERNFASGLAAGIYSAEDIPDSMNRDKVLELADYYWAEQAIATDRLRQQRADIGDTLDEKMAELFKDSDDFKPSRAITLNYRTPERNMLHIFGDERGKAINEALFGPVAVNEAERFRFINRMHDAVRTFEDKNGRQRKLTKQERALVQQVIEGRAAADMLAGMEMRSAIENAAQNIRNGEDAGDAAKEFSLSGEEQKLAIRYARWMETEEAMRSGNVDTAKVEAAAKKYSELFNQFYDAINDFLVAHGYEPIGFIRGYAPHLQPEDNHTLLNKAFNALGINTDVTRLPSSIAGLTANYKPNKRWNPYFLQRTSDITQYDIASAFESYVDYMSDVLYHTDDIMRVRAAARYFRQTYAPEEIKNNLSWAKELRYGTTEEKANFLRDNGVISKTTALTPADVNTQLDEYVEKLFADITKTTKYSDLVTWLDNYANILAAKQSMADRSPESMWGREILNFGNKLVRAFSQANVAGNLSSVLNQTAQLPMIQAELGTRWTAAAIKDIITGQTRRGGWEGESDFLTGKKGIEYLTSTPGEMVLSAMFKPAEIMDSFVSAVAVRGKYLKEIHAGKSHQEAMKAADRFGTAVMGSRMKGSKPLAFSSKNPIYQMVNVFQIEAFNSWEHVKEDLPRDFRTIEKEQGKAKAALALAGVIVKGLLLAFLANRLAEELYGGTPAPFDLLGLTSNFIASGEGLTTNTYLKTLIDNAWEKINGERLFDTDAEEIGDEPFDWEQALGDLGYNLSNEIPFFRNVSGLLGWGDETLPMPDLYGTGKNMVNAIKNNGAISWDSGKAALAMLAQLLPGGRQLQKTLLGAETLARGGDFSGTGEKEKLKYPVEDDFWSAVQAMMFGKYATEASDAYYASGASALSVNQTKLWRELTADGADSRMVYDAIQEYREISNNGELTSFERGQQERELISSLDLTDDQKLEMYQAMTNADSRTEKFRAIMYTGLSFNQVMDVYDKYAEINDEEGKKASERATEFAKWIDGQGFKESQAQTIKEQLKYWTSTPAEATRYEKLTDAGLEIEDAGDLTKALAALQPEPGKESVSNMQKYRLIASWDLSDREKAAAIGTVMGTDMTTEAGNPSAYAKMLDLLEGGVTLDEYLDLSEAGDVDGYVRYKSVDRGYGITPQDYITFRERLPEYDANGNGSYTQEEVQNALDSMGGGGLSLPSLNGDSGITLTNTQKAVLWQLSNKSWKPGKNPYDTTVGEWVYDALHAEPDAGLPSLGASGLPSQSEEEAGWISLPSLGD